MSKNETAPYLLYGQGILIKAYKGELKGILSAKGFADTRARFQTYDDILFFKNYRNAIYQILPASSFDINDELRYLIENNLGGSDSNLEILKAKAESEKDQFELNVKSKKKNYVCFGDEVVFKHIDSGTYLSGTISPSDGSNGAFSVEVTQDLKATLVFRLLPYRSFENESNPIPLQSPILIENVYNKGYLTFEKYGLKEQKQKAFFWDIQPIKSDDSYKIPVKTESANSEIYECVTHFSDLSMENQIEKMPWKFELHFNDVQNDKLVQHDIVYFQHTMNNGVLSASGDSQIFLKELKGEKTAELRFYDCLWEIEEFTKQQGGEEHQYIVRHLMSGMTLGIEEVKPLEGSEKSMKPVLIDISQGKSNEGENKLGVIKLKLAKKKKKKEQGEEEDEGGDIQSNSYINIMWGDMCLDVSNEKEKEKEIIKAEDHQRILMESQKFESDEKTIDRSKLESMAMGEFDYEIKKLEFTMDISKNCFIIQEIDEDLKSEVLFALSFHSRLINLREDLKWGALNSEKKVTYQRMMQITEKAKEIKYFLKNTTKEDPNREFKSPIPKRQVICLHLGISELLFELLLFMRKNRDGEIGRKEGSNQVEEMQPGHKIFQDKPNEEEKFIEMYNAIYEVIFELIRGNLQFKIHVSKWIDFIFEDIMRYNEEYQLKTLLQLLTNNSFFINNFIKGKLIDELVYRMLNEGNHEFHERKYIEIFRGFCICGSEVNSENQDLILNKFLKKLNEEQNGYKYQIKMAKKKNEDTGLEQIYCCAAVDKNEPRWRRFEDYYKICRDEYKSAWEYLYSFLNLIADMTKGRNKTVESYIEIMLTQEVLSELMIKYDLHEVEDPIIRIMHFLYAESQKFYPIDRVTRVINYNALSKQQIKINSTLSEVRPKALIGSVMDCIIFKLENYGYIRMSKVEKNKCLNVILDFIRETFLLGFWEDKKDVVRIFKAIKKILKAPKNIDYEKIRAQSQKPEVILMISCKEKCMEIIECIIDLDIDLRLKLLSNTFKQFEIPPRKLEVEIGNFLEASEQSGFAFDFVKAVQRDQDLQSEKQSKVKNTSQKKSKEEIENENEEEKRERQNEEYWAMRIAQRKEKREERKKKRIEAREKRKKEEEERAKKGLPPLPPEEVSEDQSEDSQYDEEPESEEKSSQIVSAEVCNLFIELSKHNHPGLTCFSLKILQKILDMDKNVVQKFFDLVFVCQNTRIDLHQHVSKIRDKFFTLEYQNTTKINAVNQKNLYFMMHKDEKEAGIMQDLYMISELVKNQNSLARIRDIRSLDGSGTYKNLATEKLINFTSERRSSNLMKQQVIDASNIHQKVLKYIFNCKEIPTEELAIKLLHLSYKFIVSIIENNQEVKLTLIQHIPKMIHHVQKNLGCIDFLKEMYDNNRNMLYNDTEILKLIKVVCDSIDHENAELSYYKSKLLDFFRYLIYCNGRALSYNQIQILKIMQDDSYEHIIADADPKRISQLVALYEKDYEEGNSKYVVMDPELVYLTTFFQIMVSLIDDKCKVNSGKLIKKFPFDTLIQCIQRSSKCWPLKRNIRAFINRLYYFEPEIETYMSSIISFEVDNIIKDLNYFIQIKCKSTVADFQALYFENPVRFSYLQSYLYLNLEENLFTLYQLVQNPELLKELKNYLHSGKVDISGPYNFIRICERLGWIRNYFASQKNIFTTSFIKFLMSKLKAIINEFDDNIYTEGMVFSGDKVPTKQEKEKARVYLIEKITLGEISSFFVQGARQISEYKPLVYLTPPKIVMPADSKQPNREKLMRKLKEILTRTKREFQTIDEEIRYKQNKLISALRISSKVSEELIHQYNKRLEVISKAGEIQKSGRFEGEANLLLYIKSMIEINSESPESFSPELKIFFLKMIIGILEQTNTKKMDTIKPVDEWDSEDYIESSPQILKIQLEFKNCKVATFITELLKENIIDNIPLANNILLCGIAYLLGGNKANQESLIAEINKGLDNKVFRNIANLISKLGKLILKNIDESNYKPTSSDSFQIEIIDNYDFYDEKAKYCLRKNVFEPNSTNEIIYHQECIITYRRAFRFLQLLCENNNIENKKYIREQAGKQDQVNFINVTTSELRNLFEVICKSIIDVPEFLLDFLIEITQIPVKQNQEALMNSTFFEDLCQMGNELSKKDKLTTRGFEKNTQPLETIFSKSVQIILSNFQGNDETTYRILDSKLDPNFLINILVSRFKAIGVTDKTDLLNYIKESLEHEDDNGKKHIETMYSEEIIGIFDILIIFKKLQEKFGHNSRLYENYQKFKGGSKEMLGILNYLEESIINIEINDSNNEKQTIFFPKQPVYYSLSTNNRDYVMSRAGRETHRDKIVSLMGYTTSLKESMEYSYTLKKTEGIVERNMTDSYKYAAIMSCVVCVFLMLYYNVIVEFGEAEFTSNRIYRSIGFALCLIQLSLSSVYAYYWYILKIWYKPEYLPKEDEKETKVDENAEESWLNDKLKKIGIDMNDKSQKFYNNGEFYRLAFFVGVSFFGTFFHPPLFYIHIIDILCQSDLLADIFQAIGGNVKSLVLVSLMGVVFTLVFCTVSFKNYMGDIYAEESDEMCDTMTSCVLALFVSGAIGQMQEFELSRFSFDTVYMIFFSLLFGNIVSGIMLESFASLRDSNATLVFDKSNFCYICNVNREKLEKKRIRFKDHIMHKHFLWNYVFYVITLKAKSPTDYTGLEYEIITQVDQKDEDMKIDWIPDGEESDYDPMNDIENLISISNDYIENVSKSLKDFQKMAQDFEQQIVHE